MPPDKGASPPAHGGGMALTRRNIFMQSWPIMLANAAAPLVGLVDTFVIGRYSHTAALAGIGLGAAIYAIIYVSFGFLRMSTAGLTAQSDGAGDRAAVQAHILRAVPLGLAIGLFFLVAQALLFPIAFHFSQANEAIENAAQSYISARLWGLPAMLGSAALTGWFIGISRTGLALKMQIVLNLINVILSPLFVIMFGWGLYGVGIATAIAEWSGLAAGALLALAEIKRRGGLIPEVINRKGLLNPAELKRLAVTNSNIFIRTICITFAFTFFAYAAAREGEVFLAGNHILMQLITITALVLDAFAHTAEAVTGAAYGAKNRARFERAVRLTSEFSMLFGVLISATIFWLAPYLISALTHDPAVIASARTYLPYCALVPLLGFAAWQLDGIFIGTTRTLEMRNASIAAMLIYLAAHYILTPIWGAHGLWLAFLLYYPARALTLGFYYPRLRRAMGES